MWGLEPSQHEMVEWYHWLNGHKSEQTAGNSEGQGSLACCSLWEGRELDVTQWVNSNNMAKYVIVAVPSCSVACSCVQLFVTPCTVLGKAPLSMEYSRQGCWSGLPFPSPGDLPNPGNECASLVSPALAGRFFTTELHGKPKRWETVKLQKEADFKHHHIYPHERRQGES